MQIIDDEIVAIFRYFLSVDELSSFEDFDEDKGIDGDDILSAD